MRLVIRGGTVVTSTGRNRMDITCEDGLIRSLDSKAPILPEDEVLEAGDLLVFPGFIDPHVHSRDPGQEYKEDFSHVTRAAAAGGVTTVLDMPNAIPPVTDAKVFTERADHHSQVAHVDFGLWGVSLGAANIASVTELLQEGAVAIKLFWGYALDRKTKLLVYNYDENDEDLIPPPSNVDVCELFRLIGEAGGVLGAHCEDRALIQVVERHLGEPADDYQDVLRSRPAAAEAAAVAVGAEYSNGFGCHFHVLHVSAARTVKLIQAAQADGIWITAETCPHYLALTDQDLAAEANPSKVYPPVRAAPDREALWQGLEKGTIFSIGSDHAPHTKEEKEAPLSEQPAGYIGVESMVRVVLDAALSRGLPLERIAWVMSEATARLYGIHPRKGSIQPGSDADFTIVDPEAHWTIKSDDLHSKNKNGPWDGRAGKGAPVLSVLRGSVVMKDLQPVGDPSGRLVRARHRTLPQKMVVSDR